MNKHLDLSHTITNGLLTYKGLPATIICDFLSREASKAHYEEGTSFQIAKVEMVTNTGTYIDCPFHRYEDGKQMSELALQRLVDLPAVLIEAPYDRGLEIGEEHFQGVDLEGKAVLLHTGWDMLWQTDSYFENHPYLSASGAAYLRDHGAVLVGIDSYNLDDTRTNKRPAHSILLKEDILIIEHLCNLQHLKGEYFTFSAIPPKIEGVGSFPVRAFATIPGK